MDVIEIDAASIAALMKSEILKESFRRRRPSSYKVYIIDEVHNVNRAAFTRS